MDNIWLQSALWVALALVAAMGSLWIMISFRHSALDAIF
jgi:hypothetical protein